MGRERLIALPSQRFVYEGGVMKKWNLTSLRRAPSRSGAVDVTGALSRALIGSFLRGRVQEPSVKETLDPTTAHRPL